MDQVRYSVVLGQWLDQPLSADVEIARFADQLGYEELWVPEMAKADAPAMAGLLAAETERIGFTIGPLAVTVRSSVQIALAVSTLAATGRRTDVALGTSSSLVARWHGRSRAGAAAQLATTTSEVRALFDGGRVNGYRLQEPPRRAEVTVAAFGPRAVLAAQDADRMVLNMLTVDSAGRLATRHPRTAIWLAAAIDPTDEERDWLTRGFVGYLGAPGYSEMFVEAGYADAVEVARSGAHPRDVLASVPDQLLDDVALVGDEATVRRRIERYRAAGVDEICLVVSTPRFASPAATLEAFRPT